MEIINTILKEWENREFPKAISRGFNLEKYIRVRLTDATEDGGLLGIRF